MGNLSVVDQERPVATVQCDLQFMVNGYFTDGIVKPDYHKLKTLMIELTGEPGRYSIFDPVVQVISTNQPAGISGFLMLAENHISFHTFPNRGHVVIDLYTIYNDIDRDRACSRLIDAFGIVDVEIHIRERNLANSRHQETKIDGHGKRENYKDSHCKK